MVFPSKWLIVELIVLLLILNIILCHKCTNDDVFCDLIKQNKRNWLDCDKIINFVVNQFPPKDLFQLNSLSKLWKLFFITRVCIFKVQFVDDDLMKHNTCLIHGKTSIRFLALPILGMAYAEYHGTQMCAMIHWWETFARGLDLFKSVRVIASRGSTIMVRRYQGLLLLAWAFLKVQF